MGLRQPFLSWSPPQKKVEKCALPRFCENAVTVVNGDWTDDGPCTTTAIAAETKVDEVATPKATLHSRFFRN